MKVGLFFGSFNPIHHGHLIIAQAALNQAALDQIWFVVSPQNPHKKSKNLLHEFDRLDLVERAIADNFAFKSCDIEFSLTKPSYTIDTLIYLTERHPTKEFSLILGGAFGNLVDRVLYGYVIDFIDLKMIVWTVFNIADSAITIGALIIAVKCLLLTKHN